MARSAASASCSLRPRVDRERTAEADRRRDRRVDQLVERRVAEDRRASRRPPPRSGRRGAERSCPRARSAVPLVVVVMQASGAARAPVIRPECGASPTKLSSGRGATFARSFIIAAERLPWRLLLSPPLGGPENMALDEALMARARRTGETVLRVYAWSRADALARPQPARASASTTTRCSPSAASASSAVPPAGGRSSTTAR